MTKKLYTPAERVRDLLNRHGSYMAASKECHVSVGWLHAIANGQNKEISADILYRLGFDVGPEKFPLRSA